MTETPAELLLGPARHTRGEVASAAGFSIEETARLWAALGFAHVGDDDRVFTDADIAVLKRVRALLDAGVVTDESLVALARLMGHALWRVATSFVQVLEVESTGSDIVDAGSALVDYVWRRQLLAAVERAGALAETAHPSGSTPAAVAFVDLSRFTAMSRRASVAEIGEVVDRFEAIAAFSVVEGGGRLVKTLGDAAMFTAPDAGSAAAIAMRLLERIESETDLPPAKAGLALGRVLDRFGDVYGEPVNIASRLTDVARPGTVLADRAAATALRQLPEWSVQPLRRHDVRGYANLAPYRVRRREDT